MQPDQQQGTTSSQQSTPSVTPQKSLGRKTAQKSLMQFIEHHPEYIEKFKPIPRPDPLKSAERVVLPEPMECILSSSSENKTSAKEDCDNIIVTGKVQETDNLQSTPTDSANLASTSSLNESFVLDKKIIPVYHDADTQCHESEIDKVYETERERDDQQFVEEIDARIANLDKRQEPFVVDDDDRFVTKVCRIISFCEQANIDTANSMVRVRFGGWIQ